MRTKFAPTYVRELPWEQSLLLRMSRSCHENKVCSHVCQGAVMGTKFAPAYVKELS